jgi:hypothetical protein
MRMLPQKAFEKSNPHSTTWRFKTEEILCNKKYTLSPYSDIMEVIEVKQ